VRWANGMYKNLVASDYNRLLNMEEKGHFILYLHFVHPVLFQFEQVVFSLSPHTSCKSKFVISKEHYALC